jgi:hypothetical protein
MRRLLKILVLGLGLALLGPLAPAAHAGPIGTPPPRPEADYRFQNRLSSTVAGAPVLRNLNGVGVNTFGTEDVEGHDRTVLQFPEGNGLRLGNATSLVTPTRYTIAMKFRFDAVANYARVITFKPDANTYADTGLYVDDSDLIWYDRRYPDFDNILPDQWVTVVLTRATSGVVRAYVQGTQVFSFDDFNGRARIDPNGIVRFFRDDESDEESSGAVARIRIWDEVLTPSQVAHLSAV